MYDLTLDYDVVIIGGGPAGLSAALMLGRSHVSTLVLDTEQSYGPKGETHLLLTRDGATKAEIRAAATADLQAYPYVTCRTARVATVSNSGIGYDITLEGGETVSTQRLVFALGTAVDTQATGITGLAEALGHGVYTCPFCHGFEQSGKRAAIIGAGPIDEHFIPLIHHWCPDADFISHTHGAQIAEPHYEIGGQAQLIDAQINEISGTDGAMSLQLSTGETREYDVVFIGDLPLAQPNPLIAGLGIEVGLHPATGKPVFKTDATGRTDLGDVFVIGDARTGFSTLPGAAQEGMMAGFVLVNDIIASNSKALAKVSAL